MSALRSGDCEIVEGTVERFHPMPHHGRSLESFTVNGVHFSYSDFDVSKPGFNHTESHGGPIHSGMHVRIHYRAESILQVEVLRELGLRQSVLSRRVEHDGFQS
jgi:hypothetical protein